jgi:hypothetical protein
MAADIGGNGTRACIAWRGVPRPDADEVFAEAEEECVLSVGGPSTTWLHIDSSKP